MWRKPTALYRLTLSAREGVYMDTREQELYNLYFVEMKSLKEIKQILHIHDRTITSIFKKNNWQKRPKHQTLKTTNKVRLYTDRDWLNEQYTTLHKSCIEIAEELGVSETTINFWLNRLNIEARKSPNKGIKMSDKWRQALSNSHKGKWLGAKNPNWKGGITKVNQIARHLPEYFEWRNAVFIRDNYTCQCCKVRGGKLHAHHILPFATYPKNRYDVNNGITYCAECHHKLHRRVVSLESTILVEA